MKRLILLPLLFLFVLLVLPAVNSAPLLIQTLTIPEATTNSDDLVSVGSDTFFVNLTTDVTIFMSFEAEVTNAQGDCINNCDVRYELELDGNVIIDRDLDMSLSGSNIQDHNSVSLLINKTISTGLHTLELFHSIELDEVFTHDISTQIITNLLPDNSPVNHFSHQFDVTTDIQILVPFQIFNTTFSTFSDGDLLTLIQFEHNRTDATSSLFTTYHIEIDGIAAPGFRQQTNRGSGLTGFLSSIGSNFIFENLPAGNHTLIFIADGSNNKGIYVLRGTAALIELTNDGVSIENTQAFDVDNPVVLALETKNIFNATINIVNNNSAILAIASMSSFSPFSAPTAAESEIKFQLNGVDGAFTKRQAYGSQNRINMVLTEVFTSTATGINTIQLFGSAFVTNMTYENISISLIEVADYDENIQIPPLNFKAAEDRNANNTALLVHDEIFADGLTVSDTYSTLGTISFEVNKTTDINILTNFEVELENTGGAATGETGNWRILLDGSTIAESEQFFLPPDAQIIDSMILAGAQQNVGLGSHTVELQHKVTGERLLTRKINLFVNSNTFSNQTIVNRNGFEFDFKFSTTNISFIFSEIGSGNFTTEINQDLISLFVANYSKIFLLAQEEIFLELDGESGPLAQRQVGRDFVETFGISYNNLFEDVPAGFHTWKMFARNLPFSDLNHTGDVSLVFFETKADGLEITTNSLRIEKEVNLSPDIFLEYARIEIDLADQSDLAVLFSATFDTNSSPLGAEVNRDSFIDVQIRTKQGTSLTRNLNILGSRAGIGAHKRYNFNFIDIFEDFPQGKTNVSIFVKSTPEKFNIINSSIILIEVNDYDLNFVASQGPPVVTIIAPANLTITNIFPLNITFTVSTGAPGQPDASCSLQNSTNIFSSGTFPLNTNVNLTLTEGQDINRNFTLDISCQDNGVPFNIEGSARINVFIDNILPQIAIGSPQNGVRFNTDISTFINISGVCTDFPVFRYNITIRNVTGETIFDDELRNDPVLANSITLVSEIATSSLALGFYNVTHTCTDTHTKAKINPYQVSKEINQSKITWITDKENEFELRPSPQVFTVLDFGSSIASSGDKYNVWYVFDIPEDGTLRTFEFELENRFFPITYLPESRFNGHFIMEDNWFDFEFGDENATYVITQNDFNNYEIDITTTKTTLNFSSIGDLNTQIVATSFEVFFIEQLVDALVIGQCPDNLADMIILALIIGFALFFIWIGFAWDIGFSGLFGSIILLISTWYFVGCIQLLAFAVALLAIVLLIYFPLKGFFVNIRNI